MRWRRAAAGLTLAVAVVALLVYGVGWEEVLENVRRANPVAFTVAVVVGLGMLALRAALVYRLLAPVDGSARGLTFVTAYLTGYFARSALPWSRSTGTPITAYLLSRPSESEFEDNLAVVAAAEAFNVLASLVVAVVGVILVAAVGGGSLSGVSTSVALLTAGGLVAVVLVAVVFERGLARSLTVGATSRLESAAGRVPKLSPERADGILTARIEGFFRTLEAIQASRRTLAAAFAIAVVSWLFNAAPLYFVLLALGVDVPFALVLVCAPLASFGGVVPLPGGSGGVEIVLAGLLVATAGVSAGAGTAGAILYRLSTYWAHLVLCGIVAVYHTLVPPESR
ncbi:lysylphosphatidylglycerol synthase transmembrane domain-containing protein [Natrarchaeobaculum aegyptiacum]|uniref:TIGR00374 family protein n=1 Tax=Natrarchaeobaculum aegyptiacum TaxID=745377 RepID=A0A2Z2HNC5_9EURY|nr:flippase-like domain-containing protein [Natrarchaeobaculum aegyptiacum]ARS88400.1 TIGR00374 family protein [Natrarchaeobaculum aegyptiacum]